MLKKNLLISALIFFSFLIIYSCGKNPASPSAPSDPVSTNTFQPTATQTDTVPPGSTNTSTVPPGTTFTGTPTPFPDSYETDNVYTAANEITNAETQTHSIHVWDDEDWMYFNLTEESCVSITTTDSIRCYIEVFEESDTVNSSFTGGDGESAAAIEDFCFVQPGKYYIKIRAFNYEPITSYKITLNHFPMTTETPTEEDTATETYTTEETATDTETETPTETETYTVTASNTPTYTPTRDEYEPDDISADAKWITPEITQYRTINPQQEYDYVKFSVPYPSLASAYINGENSVTYHVQFLDSTASTYMETGVFVDIGSVTCTGAVDAGINYILIYGDNYDKYSLDFNFITLTPTHTPTNTYTSTNTFTPEYTFTNTGTETPTASLTPTPQWSSAATFGFNNSGYLDMHADDSGYSVSYMNGTLYIDSGWPVTTYAEGGWLGTETVFKKDSSIFCTFTESAPSVMIHVKSSFDNYAASLGGGAVARGYYPCVAALGNTVYAAFTDITGGTDIRTSVKYSYDNGAWQYLGGDGGVYNQPDEVTRRLSMDALDAGTHDIYVAYSNPYNQIIVKHNNGNGWIQSGSNAALTGEIGAVKLDMVDSAAGFCAGYNNSDHSIYVSRLSGGVWSYAGTNPVVPEATTGNGEFSLCAVSSEEAYLAFQNPSNARLNVMKFNGTEWVYLGDPSGISVSTVSTPKIVIYNGILYCGFIDWDQLGIVNIISYE